eukprot:TRINITY_DN4136_c0_g1_i6.p1 TRINITY_DN4136_c0_g1~~TRINITY_DN4136_c0_g1_i6.p1  ORF type:complete len:218 (+),score=28.46 TRINITY_DN4136_c0_g1_i6:278-931(+)
MREGVTSRFWDRVVPKVCWALDINSDEIVEDAEEPSSKEILTQEICPDQSACKEEAHVHLDVAWTLDPKFGSSWLAYFRTRFHTEKLWEVYDGDTFVRNQKEAPKRQKNDVYEYCPVWTLLKTTRSCLVETLLKTEGSHGHKGGVKRGIRLGVLQIFRCQAVNVQNFGMWLGYYIDKNSSIFYVDVQQGQVFCTIKEAVTALEWAEFRDEIFFAPLR